MNIEVGMKIHDIYKRNWLVVTNVSDDKITLKNDYGFGLKFLTRKEFENLYKASPLNK